MTDDECCDYNVIEDWGDQPIEVHESDCEKVPFRENEEHWKQEMPE